MPRLADWEVRWHDLLDLVFSRASHLYEVKKLLAGIGGTKTFRRRFATIFVGLGLKRPMPKLTPTATPTQKPPPVIAAELIDKQNNCDHLMGHPDHSAYRVYTAGRHGHFAKCGKCDLRFRWETDKWVRAPYKRGHGPQCASSSKTKAEVSSSSGEWCEISEEFV